MRGRIDRGDIRYLSAKLIGRKELMISATTKSLNEILLDRYFSPPEAV